jgi:hypothetical protein
MVSPVAQQPGGFGCYAPILFGQVAPAVHPFANFVDHGGQLIALLLGADAVAFVQCQLLLQACAFLALFGLWHRCHKVHLPASGGFARFCQSADRFAVPSV